MPYLPEAVESVAAQSYRNFELIVQDGGSTDGTLEFLQRVNGIPAIQIQSEADSGVGQARNRAIQRCSGEIVGIIDADNLMEKDVLREVVDSFEKNQDCAAIYGAAKLVDSEGRCRKLFQPECFDLLRLMKCDLVPPFGTSFFSRNVCGEELRFDESLKTCEDFDLWLRISHLRIAATQSILGSARLSEKSMTYRTETYEQFCKDKIAALEHYLARYEQYPFMEIIYRLSVAGIYSWAAKHILESEGPSKKADEFFEKADAIDPSSDQLRSLIFVSALGPAIHYVYDKQPMFAQLEYDLNRNLTSGGKRTPITWLRIVTKFLFGRYPENKELYALNKERYAFRLVNYDPYPASPNSVTRE